MDWVKAFSIILNPKVFKKHQLATIKAVFPPTTVASINTLESGKSPKEHAWLGWSLYFHEWDRFIDIFPYQDSLTMKNTA